MSNQSAETAQGLSPIVSDIIRSARMTLDEYREKLGAIVQNLHALEFLLRVFLQGQPNARPMGIPPGTDIYSFPVGSNVPENELTSYDSLCTLIAKFNCVMTSQGKQTIDLALVELRDTIAHGRVSAPTRDGYLRLLKFDRPVGGQVKVTFNEVMTEDWFKAQTERTWAAVKHVAINARAGIQ